MQTAESWMREDASNNFLYNAGSEMNSASGFYDLLFRNYDAALGRFFQVDPLAAMDVKASPFVYAGNNPVVLNDSSGLTTDYSTSWENPDYAFAQMEAGMLGMPAGGAQHFQKNFHSANRVQRLFLCASSVYNFHHSSFKFHQKR
jgi:RHS repeat-associated protein